MSLPTPKTMLCLLSAILLWGCSQVQYFQQSEVLSRLNEDREERSVLLREVDSSGIFSKLLFNENKPRVDLGILRKLGFVHVTSAAGIHLLVLHDVVRRVSFKVGVFLGLTSVSAVLLGRIVSVLCFFHLWFLMKFRIGFLRPLLVFCFRQSSSDLLGKWRLFSPLVLAVALDGTLVLVQKFILKEETVFWGGLPYLLSVAFGVLAWRVAKQKTESIFIQHFYLSLGSWSVLAVVEAIEKEQLSVLTALYSFVSVQFFTFIVYPTLFLFSILPQKIFLVKCLLEFLRFQDECISALIKFAFQLSGIFFVSRWGVVFSALLAFFVIFYQLPKKPAIAIGVCVFLLKLIPFSNSVEIAQAQEVVQLNVGQGDSALVLSKGGTGLIDVGPGFHFSSVKWIDLFSKYKITEIDWILLSHLDEDHVGALTSLSKLIPIGCVVVANEVIESKKGNKIHKELIQDEVPLRKNSENECIPFLIFQATHEKAEARNGNMLGTIVPLESGGNYFSFGDADAKAEEKSIKWLRTHTQWYSEQRRIFKVSHHGSKHSSNLAFLNRLAPSSILISVGAKNTYGHPALKVLKTIEELKIPSFRTDLEGDLSVLTHDIN